MKRITYLFIVLVSILVITGCSNSGKSVLTCTGTKKGNDMDAEGKIVYTFKDDKVYTVNLDVTFKNMTAENLDSLWPTFKAQLESQNQEVDVDGLKRKITVADKKHEFNVKMEIDFEKVSDELIDENNLNIYKDKTYEEVKKYTEETDQLTCK